MDVAALRKFAGEAQVLADRAGRDDLWADAQAWMASAMVSDGDVPAAIHMDREAIARAGGIRSFGLARTPLTLYWAGLTDEAIQHGLQAVGTARASEDPPFLMYALQHLGLSLSGAGRFDDAVRVFDEARAFGTRCGALPLLARATSMSVAPLLSLGDLDGAMARAFDARELAHRVAFEPPLVSAGIDLLMIFARQQDPGGPTRSGRECAGGGEGQRLACMEMEHPTVAGASRTGVCPRCMGRSRSRGNVCDRSEPVSTPARVRGAWAPHESPSGASAGREIGLMTRERR